MPDAAWKDFERRVAADLGGKRNPYSGSSRTPDSPVGTAADVVHPDYWPECKQWARPRPRRWDAFIKARARAQEYGREYMLLLDDGAEELQDWRGLLVLHRDVFKATPPQVVAEIWNRTGTGPACSELAVRHSRFVVDHDVRRDAPYFPLYQSVVDQAAAEGDKVPVLCVSRKNSPGWLAICGVGYWAQSEGGEEE